MSNPGDVDIIVVVNEEVQHIGRLVHHVHERHPWLRFEILQRTGRARSFGALARFGTAYSTSQYVVLVSPYGGDDVTLIHKMLQMIRQGYQVVQVTRYADKGPNPSSIPGRFRLYQVIYRFLIRVLLGFRISDSTYHFKMFDRVFIQALGLNQNGYSVCPEITLKALLARGRVTYISSSVKENKRTDFRLTREGPGYLWLLARGTLHRCGILWF